MTITTQYHGGYYQVTITGVTILIGQHTLITSFVDLDGDVNSRVGEGDVLLEQVVVSIVRIRLVQPLCVDIHVLNVSQLPT